MPTVRRTLPAPRLPEIRQAQCRLEVGMSRWRVAVVLLLLLTPVVILAALGSWFLFERGLSVLVWWPLTACMIAGYLLALYWQRRRLLVPPIEHAPPMHWTDRDRQAWRLVEARVRAAENADPDQLLDSAYYLDTAKDLARELGRFYHPKASDYVGALTLPEILAVVELAAGDVADLVTQTIPGGHLITIDHLRRAKWLSDQYQTVRNLTWLTSALFNPVHVGLRYAATRAGMDVPTQLIRNNLLVWFFGIFVQRVGHYLIELNSGRLRVGARRYRQLLAGDALAATPPADDSHGLERVTLLVLGQAKTGKSSFINALLGEHKAITDVLPVVANLQRYELQPEGITTRLVLVDSTGYGRDRTDAEHVRATELAATQADVLILVLHARNPARQLDLDMLQRLRDWFAARPDLKMPPVLAVLTHIDLLTPAMEWQPPYDWIHPTSPKEQAIHDACAVVKEQFSPLLVGVAPVCVAPGKVHGVEEWFLPQLAEVLNEAKAVAMLRCLRAERDEGKVRKVFRQMASLGKTALEFVRRL
jgi:predicted GTPase